MSHRGFKITAAAAAAALAALPLIATPALASPARVLAGPVHPLAGPVRAGSSVSPAGGSQRVMLITGDIVTVSTLAGGRQTASVIRAASHGPGAQFQTFSRGTDLYVVPQSAVPYLGSTLSPALFDVTALARQQHGLSSMTVGLRLRSAASAATVPGITLTRRAGLTVTGRLTQASARRFGAALARQAQRDHASASDTTGLFAGVARIGPAAAAPQVRPDFPMYTLTLNGINAAGAKDTGDLVAVYNVDDLRKYAGSANFANGQAKISVPTGNYTAICFFFNFTNGSVDEVMLPQFSVTGNTSVTLDARSATSPVSVATPQPAAAAITSVGIGRADRLGNAGSDAFIGSGTTAFSVEPATKPVSAGQLHYFVYSRLLSPAGAKSPYSYDVEFPSDGAIPADQHYAADAGNLAAVRSSYPAAKAGQAALDTRFGALPWQSFLFGIDLTLTTPLQRTEYYTASPAVSWEGVYNAVYNPSPFTLLSQFESSWRSYQPGDSYSTTWDGAPAHPRLLQTDLFVNQVYCPACISGSTLYLLAFPFADNSPEHRSYPDSSFPGLTESETYDVYADGVQVKQGTGFLQATATLPSGTHDVQIDYNTARSSPYLPLSTSAATSWTVRANAPSGTLPAGWYCDLNQHTRCTVLPLMTADYALPVNMLGQLSPGPVTAGVDIGHLTGAAGVAVTALTVSVSFDGGTSWHPAAITANGSGQYAASFTIPPAAQTGGFGALRIRAADAYGGTFSQTIQHAFAIAGS